jgi:signal transduction histidine kinase
MLARGISDALADLRAALAAERGGTVGTQRRVDEVVARVRPDHPRLSVQLIGDTTATVSAALEPLVHHFLAEAIANAERHASASRVDVVVRHTPYTLCVEIGNDGVAVPTRPAGIGLRLVVEHALQHGALVDYGASSPGRWRTRLVLAIEPNEQEAAA